MFADADDAIKRLELAPHPEGGWYRETWRGPPGGDGRSLGTTILYLLRAGERSHWHRIDATELWLHQGGGVIRLCVADAEQVDEHRLGPDLERGHVLQVPVPAGAWQMADTTAPWALVACVVVPGFDFSGFQLAPEGWKPQQS